MHTKQFILAISISLAVAQAAFSEEHSAHADMAHEHGGGIFHKFRLELEAGGNSDGESIQSWDLDGWIGTDEDKLWLKSEGEHVDGHLDEIEFWALYSRNILTFWDAQAGIKYDTKPEDTAYLVLGFSGLAPQWLETEAYLFISDEGDVTAQLQQETEILLTQQLVLEPYFELNLSAQEVHDQEIGAGFTDGKIGLQTRYEFTRKFAPYVDIHYGQKFGETSSIAKDDGEENNELVGSIGLRLMF